VYSRLPSEEAHDYDKLKLALLKRFQLTEDGFKERFRSARAEKGESPVQFLARLGSYFIRWVDMAQIDHDFISLVVLLVREQYINTCSKDLALFLKERKPTSIDELAQIAEQYLETHPTKFVDKRDDRSITVADQPTTQQRPIQRGQISPTKRCFICNKVGQIARNCFRRHRTAALEGRNEFVTRRQTNRQHRSVDDNNQTEPKFIGFDEVEKNTFPCTSLSEMFRMF